MLPEPHAPVIVRCRGPAHEPIPVLPLQGDTPPAHRDFRERVVRADEGERRVGVRFGVRDAAGVRVRGVGRPGMAREGRGAVVEGAGARGADRRGFDHRAAGHHAARHAAAHRGLRDGREHRRGDRAAGPDRRQGRRSVLGLNLGDGPDRQAVFHEGHALRGPDRVEDGFLLGRVFAGAGQGDRSADDVDRHVRRLGGRAARELGGDTVGQLLIRFDDRETPRFLALRQAEPEGRGDGGDE